MARRGEWPHAVGVVWEVRASIRNRALVARYPEVFAAWFPGSSFGWVRALATGTVLPGQPGLAWCDVAGTRLFAWMVPLNIAPGRRTSRRAAPRPV